MTRLADADPLAQTLRRLVDAGAGFCPPAGEVSFEPLPSSRQVLRFTFPGGDYAVVGLSRSRHDATFGGLPLQEELNVRNAQAHCGLYVIDLRSGDVVHWLRLEGEVTELYDVAVLPGVVRPMVLGFHTDEIQRMLSVDDEGTL